MEGNELSCFEQQKILTMLHSRSQDIILLGLSLVDTYPKPGVWINITFNGKVIPFKKYIRCYASILIDFCINIQYRHNTELECIPAGFYEENKELLDRLTKY